MTTPRQKANELIIRYEDLLNFMPELEASKIAKECALSLVDEILSNSCGNTDGLNACANELYCDEYFWHDVREYLI